jgi:hypothetical protein
MMTSAEDAVLSDEYKSVKAVELDEMSSSPLLSTMDEYFSKELDGMPMMELNSQENSHMHQISEKVNQNRDESEERPCKPNCEGSRRKSANIFQLRMVEGRLQAVGFVGDLSPKQNSSRLRRKANKRQKSFTEQVIFYLLK